MTLNEDPASYCNLSLVLKPACNFLWIGWCLCYMLTLDYDGFLQGYNLFCVSVFIDFSLNIKSNEAFTKYFE